MGMVIIIANNFFPRNILQPSCMLYNHSLTLKSLCLSKCIDVLKDAKKKNEINASDRNFKFSNFIFHKVLVLVCIYVTG